MSHAERGRAGAQARWAGRTKEEVEEHTRKMRASANTDEAKFKRLRTMAANLGYRLVPIED